jgi:hypothetical protein
VLNSTQFSGGIPSPWLFGWSSFHGGTIGTLP